MSKSSKVKHINTNLKINSKSSRPICSTSESPNISFKYLTKNKNYNFEYYSKEKQQCKNAKIAVLDRIQEITCDEWINLLNKPKETGVETLNNSILNFNPNGYDFFPDEKIYVFRFKVKNNKNDCRIIGFKERNCPTYNIIGFDFDYSAYNHGS